MCDGANLASQTCLSRGFYGGTLACSADCRTFVETGCAGFGRCGDATVQTAYGEDCDGTNLNGTACINLGYYGGELACTSGCDFDITDCEPFGRCGDNTIQGGHGEVCDGTSLAGQTCTSRGFHGGTLACAANCGSFDESGCAAVGRCGDGVIQAAYGEECDGSNLNAQTCGTFGFYTGTLSCDANCRLVTSGCSQNCGDGATQLSFGELCDGADLNGQSCVSRGFYDGTLSCDPDCHGFNETSCIAAGRCGDALVQTLFGEDCDGANLNSQSCSSLEIGRAHV